MSFYTSLVFYRPTDPPVIKARELADFVTELVDKGLLAQQYELSIEVKYGNTVDQDGRHTSWEETTNDNVSVLQEIDWDVKHTGLRSIQDVIDPVLNNKESIYRAFVVLGNATNDVYEPVTRAPSPENKIGFCPAQVSVSIGPIELYDLSSETSIFVGWIGLRLSGNGYLYPWTFSDVLSRIEESESLQIIMDTCRRFWPVPPTSVEKPIDWVWGLQESG
jgi:hypothetical protein